MVKRAFRGLPVFYVSPNEGRITPVTVETPYRAGKPFYEARLRVRDPNDALWDIFASNAFRRRTDAEKEGPRIREGAS